ncbi:MAG: alpha-amylase family glycosyl hydrolase [Anaerolineae bacterium]|nr:alpha-amylase family glycosyl hydrolase [Anaerolineae bacterium]
MTKQTNNVAAGMGAIPDDKGVTFRVWAPNADKVYVTGTFDDWSETKHPLSLEENGYWAIHLTEAKIGDEYKYVIINDRQTLSRIDPYAREVTNSVGNSIVTRPDFDWGDDNFEMPPWNELVIYEMHIGTFNSQGDDGPGSFENAVEKLPYLEALGINALEIMPPMEFPGGYSWGYNPSHPFALESDYGGTTAFKRLVKAAHAHGMAVILDVVYNHFGPSDLDLWQFDGWSENGMGGIYFYNDWRAATPWGDTRPDYGRGEVRQYLRDNALLWFEEYRVDGLRWDATAYVRNVEGNEANPSNDLAEGWGLMQWINQEIQDRFPGKLTIAEDLRENAWLTKPAEEGGAGFGSQWDGAFVHPIRQAIITNDDAFRDMEAVAGALAHRYDDDAFHRVIYTESHDEVANGKARIPEEIWPGKVDSWFSKKRSTLGAALALTAPGIPMLFQGQEFIEDRWFHDQDPLDWARVEEFGGIVDLYRTLIYLRRNAEGHTQGLTGQHIDVFHVNNEEKLIAFHRWAENGGPGDSVVVAANMANKSHEAYPLNFPAEGLWQVRFNSDSNHYDPEFGNHHSPAVIAEAADGDAPTIYGQVSIGPYTVIILSQDNS